MSKNILLKIGDRAPEFDLPAYPLGRVRLSDYYKKRPVILFFYPKDETAVCTKEACSFRDHYGEFMKAGAEVIGVSSDSLDSHDKFATQYRLPYKLLSDEEGKLRKTYGVSKTLGLFPGRVTFCIDKDGFIREIFSSPFQATQHVEAALKFLMEGLSLPDHR